MAVMLLSLHDHDHALSWSRYDHGMAAMYFQTGIENFGKSFFLFQARSQKCEVVSSETLFQAKSSLFSYKTSNWDIEARERTTYCSIVRLKRGVQPETLRGELGDPHALEFPLF